MNREELARQIGLHFDLPYSCGCDTESAVQEPTHHLADHIILTVLPLIEDDLRERILGEIEAHKQATYDDGSRYIQGALIALDRAARIVRGEKP